MIFVCYKEKYKVNVFVRGCLRTKEGIRKVGEEWERNKAGGIVFSFLLLKFKRNKETFNMTAAKFLKTY